MAFLKLAQKLFLQKVFETFPSLFSIKTALNLWELNPGCLNANHLL